MRAEEERTGLPVAHGRLLEVMLAIYRHERAGGRPPTGLELPEKMLKAADVLAAHLRCSREVAVTAAITEHMVRLGLATEKS